jgi:hypothetical protein
MRPEIILRDQAFPNVPPVALHIDVLRPRHYRPRRCAPEARDELPPPHS